MMPHEPTVGFKAVLALSAALALLSACGGTASIQPQAVAAQLAVPVISGTPPASISAGSAYLFQPSAMDAAGNPLSFSIQNPPPWANFSAASGSLRGTPAASDIGTYGGIVISVSDGKNVASLSSFSISVSKMSE